MSGQIGRAGLQGTVASDVSTIFVNEPTTAIQPSVLTESTNGLGGTVVETPPSPSTGILSSVVAGIPLRSSSGTFGTSETRSCKLRECTTISSNASTSISSASVLSFPSTSTSTVSPTTIVNATPSFSSSHHGLSQSSKIAAIVVPILVLLVLVPACIFCFILRNRRRHRSLHGTVEMKNVSPSSYEAPPHQMSVNRDLPPLPPQKFAQKTTSHTIPRRPLARNSTIYTGIGQEVADHNHDHSIESPSVGSAPPGYTNPNSPGLTEQNLLHHTAYGDRRPPGERTRSPFEDEDVVSDVSHTGAGRTRRRDVDEESVVSALDEGAVEKKGGGGRHDDDNESVVSALDDEHVERTSGSHGPVKVMDERTLHLD